VLAALFVAVTACQPTDDATAPPPSNAAPTSSSATPSTPAQDTPSTAASTLEFTALPTQPDGVPFPTDEWPSAPPGSDSRALATLVDEALAPGSRFGTIDAVLAIQGGAIVIEAYGEGWGPARAHPSWSIAKSVTHALVGVLVGESALDVDAPASIDEWRLADDQRSAITPLMLLQMTSGLQWDESADVVDLVAGTSTINVADVQIERPLSAAPGTEFNYSTGSTSVVGRLIGDLVGTGDDFARWSDDVLFEPLGIDSVELTFDADGYWVAGYGADMTARDFARLGLLYLRDGVWDGQRILPEGWVDAARTPTPLAPPYGTGFWIDVNAPDSFSAEGFFGQKVVVVPDADLVVVVLAQNLDDALSTQLASALVDVVRGG
jgi:CubicO group peptidase (beta-lactamase class C family)